MSHETIKAMFSEAVNHVASNISLYAVHPDKDFTRTKKLDPVTLLSFLVSCGSSSTKIELLDFFPCRQTLLPLPLFISSGQS